MTVTRERLATYMAPSSAAGLLLCLAAVVFGSSRDFGMFLLGLAGLPILAIAVIVFIVIDAKARRNAAGIGAALLVISPALYLASGIVHDRARFAAWSAFHSSVLSNPGRTRVIGSWDSWGIAGMENDSYLVVDRRRALGSQTENERWLREVGQNCAIADVQTMAPALYIVTTYNCPFDGFPLL